MSVAGARTATVQLSSSQLAVVGLGVFCIANPDKFFSTVRKAAFLIADDGLSSRSQYQQQAPIIIHQGVPSTGSSRSIRVAIVQLVVSAGLCWGSYVVLTNVLPEAAKGLLPVTNNVFNRAISSLGKAVITLRDTLMEQVLGLSQQQDELSDKQDKTHCEVLEVKNNVSDLKGDLDLVQESLDLCHATLSESERRTSYIARGVQLLTRSVGSVLPEDDELMNELIEFSTAGEEFRSTAQLNQLQNVLTTMHTKSQEEHPPAMTYEYPHKVASVVSPENEVPKTPDEVEQSVFAIKDLLKSIKSYQ